MREFQALLGSGAIVLAGVGPAAGQGGKPRKKVDLMVAAGAGRAADRQARLVQRFPQTVPGMPGRV